MLIAQITDVHIGFEPGNLDESNWQRLNIVLRHLIDGPNRPDMLIVSGDLADHGDAASYQRVADLLGKCPFPVYPCLGNHDDRVNFATIFPAVPMSDGFVQYSLRADGLRLIVLDTLEPGRHGGGFCEARARWLKARLSEDSDTPTVIVMHHPPLDVGIEWMATVNDEPWVKRFEAAIDGDSQIRAIWCGHFHRPIAAPWQNTTVTVCPATAAQLALDLVPIDAEKPDGRAMITGEAPGYALHLWRDDWLVSHFDTAQDHGVLATFDDKMQPLVRHLVEERTAHL